MGCPDKTSVFYGDILGEKGCMNDFTNILNFFFRFLGTMSRKISQGFLVKAFIHFMNHSKSSIGHLPGALKGIGPPGCPGKKGES